MSRATRARLTIALAVLGAGPLAGCANSSVKTAGSSTAAHPQSLAQHPRRAARPPATGRHTGITGPPVGALQRVRAGSSTLSVSVSRVLDPLRDSGAAPLPGTRAVGVVLTVAVVRGATYDSTASGDVSVVASSGAAAPLFIDRGACQTPATDFESLIGAGETHAGCVGFAVPARARILAVRFSPHSRAAGSVTWRAARATRGSGG